MNRYISTILLSLSLTAATAQTVREWEDQTILQVNRRPARSWFMPFAERCGDSQMTLNGEWNFRWAPRPEAISAASWTTISVPANWETSGFGTPVYSSAGYAFKVRPPFVMDEPKKDYTAFTERNPTGEYRRTFTVPASWQGGRVFLRFDGVMSAFYVTINGQRVGYSQGSNSASEFDVTDCLKAGENTIELLVHKYSDGSYLEDQDGWRFGGIHRDVTLFHTPDLHIRDYAVRTEALDATYRRFRLLLHPYVEAFDGTDGSDFTLRAQLYSPSGQLVKTVDSVAVLPVLDRDNKAAVMNEWYPQRGRRKFGHIVMDVTDIDGWTAETPVLYTLRLALVNKAGAVTQQVEQKVGFRQLDIRDGQFLVNGKAVRFRGVNRVEHDPYLAHALTEERMLQDLKLMKQAHINAVRTAHYPSHPRFYDLCDSLGIYVMDEADCENHGVRGKFTSTPAWNAAMMDRVIRLCERDKNHPSVVFWSLGNESGFGANHSAMAGWLHEYDATRFVHYEGAQGTTEGEAEQRLKDALSATAQIADRDAQTVTIPLSKLRPHCTDISDACHGFTPDPPSVDVISRFYPRVMAEYLNPGIPEGSDKERAENARWEHLLAIAKRQWTFTGGWLNGIRDTRPVLTSEYAHCMGNALGNFKEYWDEIYSDPRMLGGFIWDWVDQGIIRDGKVLYGGDFGDKPNLKAFCLNGVVKCDRQLTAKYREVQHVYTPVQIVRHADGIYVINRQHHSPLSSYTMTGVVSENGKKGKPFLISVPDVAPGDNARLISLDGYLAQAQNAVAGRQGRKDVRLNIIVSRNDAAATTKQKGKQKPMLVSAEHPAFVYEQQLSLSGNVMDYVADLQASRNELTAADKTALKPSSAVSKRLDETMKLLDSSTALFYRAPTDNDKSFGNWLAKDWTRNRIDSPAVTLLERSMLDNGGIVKKEEYRFVSGSIVVNTTLTPCSDGTVDVMQEYECQGNLPELPRMGMQLTLPDTYEALEYYGRGPWDTYPDRWQSCHVGLWRGNVTAEYAHFPVPQDCANHRETSSATLSTASGASCRITAIDAPFTFSALHYKAQDIAAVRHDHELKQCGQTIVTVDCAVLGIGNSSCGPGVLKRYSIDRAKKHTLRFNLSLR